MVSTPWKQYIRGGGKGVDGEQGGAATQEPEFLELHPAAAGCNVITYTLTEETPLLTSHAFVPVLKAFTEPAGVTVDLLDISVAARVLAQFPENLSEEQKVSGDPLAEITTLTTKANTNIMKIPHVAASIPQLKDCIQELIKQGFKLPPEHFSSTADTEEKKSNQDRYS